MSGATLVPLGAAPVQLLDSAIDDATLIVNVDSLNNVLVSDREDVQGSRVVTLTPGKSIQWPAGGPRTPSASTRARLVAS